MNKIDQLINRFLNGQLSHEEKLDLFDLLESDSNAMERFLLLSDEWVENYVESAEERERREVALERVKEKLHNAKRRLSDDKHNWMRRRAVVTAMRISSVAALFILTFFIGRVTKVSEDPLHTYSELSSESYRLSGLEASDTDIIKGSSLSQLARTEVNVPNGSLISMLLPDGSNVWLNAGSKLSYGRGFGSTNRVLELEGEAYFEVAKMEGEDSASKQFTVKNGDLSIIATGTAFNVTIGENSITTTLCEGGVTLANSRGATAKLKPDQSVEYDREKDKFGKLLYADAAVVSSWRGDKWIVRGMDMEQFIERLERRYDVEIIDEEGILANREITVTLENETIEQIMTALKPAMGIGYRIDQNIITVTRR